MAIIDHLARLHGTLGKGMAASGGLHTDEIAGMPCPIDFPFTKSRLNVAVEGGRGPSPRRMARWSWRERKAAERRRGMKPTKRSSCYCKVRRTDGGFRVVRANETVSSRLERVLIDASASGGEAALLF